MRKFVVRQGGRFAPGRRFAPCYSMINKGCNAGDPLETMGGLYRGPPTTRMVMQYIISVFQFYVVSA